MAAVKGTLNVNVTFMEGELTRLQPKAGEVFAVSMQEPWSQSVADGVQAAWDKTWRSAGLDPPALLCLNSGVTLSVLACENMLPKREHDENTP